MYTPYAAATKDYNPMEELLTGLQRSGQPQPQQQEQQMQQQLQLQQHYSSGMESYGGGYGNNDNTGTMQQYSRGDYGNNSSGYNSTGGYGNGYSGHESSVNTNHNSGSYGDTAMYRDSTAMVTANNGA
eukprot:4511883-Pyramimonas_sp.AAC.1